MIFGVYHLLFSSFENTTPSQTNTFQLILATDGSESFAIFLYPDDGIQWTTGYQSGGTKGLGGVEAQVGYDAGMYIFQVDGNYAGASSVLLDNIF